MKYVKVKIRKSVNPDLDRKLGKPTMYYPSGMEEIAKNKATYIWDVNGEDYVVFSCEDNAVSASFLADPQVEELSKEEMIAFSEATEKRKEIITNEAVVKRLLIKAQLGKKLTEKELNALDPENEEPGFGISKIFADEI